MPIRCRLGELLNQRGEGQREFADRVGLSRQTVSKLYANNATRIDFATLEKACLGLGVSVSELLSLEEPELSRRLRRASEVTVVLGAGVRRKRFGRLPTFAMAPEHVEAAFQLDQQVTRITDPTARVERRWFPPVAVWDTEPGRQLQADYNVDWREDAEKLLATTRDVLFVIGSDFVNGFTEFCLDRILDVGYDPRGKTRRPKRIAPRYRFNYPRWAGLGDRMLSDNFKDMPEAVVDVLEDQPLFEMTNEAMFSESHEGRMTFGSIVFIDEPNAHHPHCLIVGIVGSIPPADQITAKYILKDEQLNTLDSRLRQAGSFAGPVFVPARIDTNKGESGERFTFVA